MPLIQVPYNSYALTANGTTSGIVTIDSTAGIYPGSKAYINAAFLLTPTISSFSTIGTGGTLVHSTAYYYRVSALNAAGETLASTEASVTTPANGSADTLQVVINWGTIQGATSYNIYGRSTGAEQLIANVLAPTTTYTDTGSISPSGALPGSNTAATTVVPTLNLVINSVLSPNQVVVSPDPSSSYNRADCSSYGSSASSTFVIPDQQVNVASGAHLQQVTVSASTNNGLTPYFNNAVAGTAVTLKSEGPAQLYSLKLINLNAAAAYLQIFNAPAGSVTVGTTAATWTIRLAASESVTIPMVSPVALGGTGLSMAATTTATGSSAGSISISCTFA